MNILAERDPALETWKFAKEAEGYEVFKTASMGLSSFPARFEAVHASKPRLAFIATGDAGSYEKLA